MNGELENIEKAEASIDQFIERRARENKAERETEALYAESVRRFYRAREEQLAAAHLAHHERMLASHAATFEAITAHHRAERDRFARILGHAGPGGEQYPGEAGPEVAA